MSCRIASSIKKPFKRFINTGTLDRYASYWGKKPTRYIKESYNAPIVYDSDLNNLSATRLFQAQSNKIIVGGMTKVLECFYDEGEYLAGKSTTIILGGKQLELKYALGILNSRLISFWYKSYFRSMALAGGYLRIGNNEIKNIPIPNASPNAKTAIIALVDRILAAKRKDPNADTSALEREIDQLVYQLYGLTEEEIAVVEGK